MAAEITMPQLSDTMTEGTVVKWLKKEGDKVRAGEEIAEVETDKATMPMESFEAGTIALIVAREGAKVKVGDAIAVVATGKEDPAAVKKEYAGRAGGAPASKSPVQPPAPPGGTSRREPARAGAGAGAPTSAKPQAAAPPATGTSSPKPPAPPVAVAPGPSRAPAPKKPGNYQFDIIVIGGGPAGYAAAIRAGQLKQRVLCVEKENLGGTCLNWGCIPTKALLEDGAFVRKLRTEAAEHGVSFQELRVDFAKMIARSRAIADKLSKGIAHLFRKYEVKHEVGTGQLVAPHKVKVTTKEGSNEVTAEHVIIATGAKPVELPFAKFDGKQVIMYREAMTLPKQPRRMAIIGSGAIGCEFADFYNAIGTEVTIIEVLDHLLPNEDEDVSILLERSFAKRGIKVMTKTKAERLDKTNGSVKLTLSGANTGTVEADVVLVAVGVTGNVEGVAAEGAKLELFKNRVRVTPDFRTNLENVWAVGDCIALHFEGNESMAGYRHPDLAHVAHHEAVACVEAIVGQAHGNGIDYRQIPGCTYTHPQVASMGFSEKRARESGREIKIGKFPFSVSGRALAAGETEGFVKLIFDKQYGELLGVHMIGEHVTELLAELVLARKLEATEAEIIEAMHPHPTLSEAIMEAAGVADGRAIHL
jgi:dihydrolipoamide dehydrogenase